MIILEDNFTFCLFCFILTSKLKVVKLKELETVLNKQLAVFSEAVFVFLNKIAEWKLNKYHSVTKIDSLHVSTFTLCWPSHYTLTRLTPAQPIDFLPRWFFSASQHIPRQGGVVWSAPLKLSLYHSQAHRLYCLLRSWGIAYLPLFHRDSLHDLSSSSKMTFSECIKHCHFDSVKLLKF